MTVYYIDRYAGSDSNAGTSEAAAWQNPSKLGTLSAGTIQPGELYWAAALFDAAPTVRCVVQAAMAPILGHDSVLTNAPQCGFQAALAYGALPSTYPASAALLSGNGPAIYVGYGS